MFIFLGCMNHDDYIYDKTEIFTEECKIIQLCYLPALSQNRDGKYYIINGIYVPDETYLIIAKCRTHNKLIKIIVDEEIYSTKKAGDIITIQYQHDHKGARTIEP